MLQHGSDRNESDCAAGAHSEARVGSACGIYRVVPLIAARRSEVAEGLQHVMQSFQADVYPFFESLVIGRVWPMCTADHDAIQIVMVI